MIDFNYSIEVGLFMQLFLLAAILSAIVMYMTEATKAWLKAFKFCKENTWFISIICFFLSCIFAIGFKATFAMSTLSWLATAWLAVFLYLGSTGLYKKLEGSGGFWGQTVQSYNKYIKSIEEPFDEITDEAAAETKQITNNGGQE